MNLLRMPIRNGKSLSQLAIHFMIVCLSLATALSPYAFASDVPLPLNGNSRVSSVVHSQNLNFHDYRSTDAITNDQSLWNRKITNRNLILATANSDGDFCSGIKINSFEVECPKLHDLVWNKVNATYLQKQALQEALELLVTASAPLNEYLFERLGLSIGVMFEVFMDNPQKMAEVGLKNWGKGIVDDVAVSLAAALASDYVVNYTKGLNWQLETQKIVGAIIESTIIEFYSVFKVHSGDVSAVVGILFRRVEDLIELYLALSGLLDIEDRAFVAVALSIETAVILSETVDSQKARRVADEVLRDSRAIAAEIFGGDDEDAIKRIVDLTIEALVADMRGERSTAQAKTDEMIVFARSAANIHPFSLITKPLDWLTMAGSWGKDAPERAVNIILSATRLGKYTVEGQNRDQKKPEKSLVTACGSKWYHRLGLQILEVEQALRGGYSFNQVCVNHDKCYGKCNTGRSVCDSLLLLDAHQVCASAKSQRTCEADAHLFYQAVREKGEEPYRAAQSTCSISPQLGNSVPDSVATALVLDQSGSMGEEATSADGKSAQRLAIAKNSLQAFVKSLSADETISISTFSDSSSTQLSINEGKVGDVVGSLSTYLDQIQASGKTNIGAGLQAAFEQLNNSDAQERRALLMSDGENTAGEFKTEVAKFAQNGWMVCTVGFGVGAGEKQLQFIAEETGCTYNYAEAGNLINTFQQMSAYAQNRESVLQSSDLLAPNGVLSYPLVINDGAKTVRAYSSWGGSTLNMVLTDPSGNKFGQSTTSGVARFEEGATFQMLELTDPIPGQWTLEADWAVAPPTPEQVNITVSEKTDVFVRTHGLRPHYAIGEAVKFKVDAMEVLDSRKQPLLNSSVTVTVVRPEDSLIRTIRARSSNWTMYKDVIIDTSRTIEMFDDGMHDERAANDGIFAGTFSETDINGPFVYTAVISGQHKDGREVERSITGSFQVGSILQNPVSASEILQFQNNAPTTEESIDPYSDDADQDLLNRIEEMQGDGLGNF